jgi:hypothetical protein
VIGVSAGPATEGNAESGRSLKAGVGVAVTGGSGNTGSTGSGRSRVAFTGSAAGAIVSRCKKSGRRWTEAADASEGASTTEASKSVVGSKSSGSASICSSGSAWR